MLVSSTVAVLCSHGCNNTQNHINDGDNPSYNALAASTYEQMVREIERKGECDPETMKDLAMDLMKKVPSRLDEVIKFFIMVGTDLLKCCSHADDMNMAIAQQLTVLIAYMAIPNDAGFQIAKEAFGNMDSPRNIVRFYDSRNPCKCLNDAKKLFKEPLGACHNYEKCGVYCLDAKLFTCGKCHFAKHCCKECQKEGWPRHRKECKVADMLNNC